MAYRSWRAVQADEERRKQHRAEYEEGISETGNYIASERRRAIMQDLGMDTTEVDNQIARHNTKGIVDIKRPGAPSNEVSQVKPVMAKTGVPQEYQKVDLSKKDRTGSRKAYEDRTKREKTRNLYERYLSDISNNEELDGLLRNYNTSSDNVADLAGYTHNYKSQVGKEIQRRYGYDQDTIDAYATLSKMYNEGITPYDYSTEETRAKDKAMLDKRIAAGQTLSTDEQLLHAQASIEGIEDEKTKELLNGYIDSVTRSNLGDNTSASMRLYGSDYKSPSQWKKEIKEYTGWDKDTLMSTLNMPTNLVIKALRMSDRRILKKFLKSIGM